ncbi:MAG: cell surface protein SprA, partial [Bacteroidia bacterium]|nr:cell surface protein SprA [Bacteroidia bacterium]
NPTAPYDSTAWGRVPLLQSIVQAFDNDEQGRAEQDVGLDGLSDANEQSFFNSFRSDASAAITANPSALAAVLNDPSSDDYSYFRSTDYDNQNAGTLERYKKYNSMEGNSPSQGNNTSGFSSTATNIPDAEDINRDNTLSKEENYFQYHIALKPSAMVVGQNYITDVVSSTVANKGDIKWYHFKVPLADAQQVVGNIQDFKSIRFMRMFLKNFSDPVICRFGRLDLIRSEWRKYDYSLLAPGETIGVCSGTSFDVSAVSIEENGQRSPINYVLPPGIDRESDISTTNLAELNEQSLSMKVCGLCNGDSRATYKTTQFDVRKYKKLKMYVHCEALNNDNLQNGDLSLFIRLGSDFTGNYYEYEVPLAVSQPGNNSADAVWPSTNNIELETSKLIDAKLKRNAASWNSTLAFTVQDGNNKISVTGNPSLNGVRVIMIGVRNPKTSDELDHCAEIWVDELRMSDFDEAGGWAANARINAQLADFATVSLVGNKSTPGWGSIEQKVGERKKEDITSYDIATNIALDKFLPTKLGLKVPMYFGYGESISNPQYNPLDQDVLFSDALNAAPTVAYRDSIKRAAQDYTMRKSVNFTNVRKTKTNPTAKSHIYDIENFNVTYAYNQTYNYNITTDYRLAETYQGAVGYNFSTQPKTITPLSKIVKGKSNYLKLIKDFNFNYVPTSFSFRTDVNRAYTETQLRNNTGISYTQPPTFDKSFTMNRLYDVKFDLTKSVKIDFNATANARIDEPQGKIDDTEIRSGYTRRDSVRDNFWSGGRLTQYHHTSNVNYTPPLNKIPLIDWIGAPIRYGADYSWTSASLAYNSQTGIFEPNGLANTIQNSQTVQISPTLTFTSLYNKVPFLKKINQPPPPKPKPLPKPKLPADTAKVKAPVPKVPKPKTISPVVRGFFRTLMSIRTANFTYSETNGMLLPGFNPKPDYLGQDFNYRNKDFQNDPASDAPGWGFIFGSQKDIRPAAVANHWITSDTSLNNPFIKTHLENLTARVTIEPFKNFRIELNATKNYSLNTQEYFRADASGNIRSFSPTASGNYSISYLTYRTAFVADEKDYSNATFTEFDRNRAVISQRLGTNGYGPTQQDVLTYSFLAAYSGNDANSMKLDQFPNIPLPNWRITYDGLGKMKWAQQYVSQVNLSHAYRSTYNVNSFTGNLSYAESNGSARDIINNNYIPQYDIQQISISEQWGPLLGIDITWKNTLQTRLELKRDRTVSLSYSNIQVTEVRGTEYVIGAGYRIKNFKLPFGLGAKNSTKKNDLNLKADFSIRKNYTVIRKLEEGLNQPSAGNTTLSIKTSADYVLNERLNLRLFYDQNINEPFVSSSYPTSNTNIGFALRFTISQ